MTAKIITFTALLFPVTICAQVELPLGFEIVQLSDDNFQEDWLRINNCGQIVFSKTLDGSFEGYEVFVYDNGVFQQVTENGLPDRLPEINDEGIIVWQQEELVNPEGDYVLMQYQNGAVSVLDIGRSPLVNDAGHFSWKRFNNEGCENSDANVFFDDGESLVQITNADSSNQLGRLNDLDGIIWTRYDFCPLDWESDIMLYESGAIVQITTDQYQPQLPVLNNSGMAAWAVDDKFHNEYIETWADGVTKQLTHWGNAPKLNNLGHIVFDRWDEGSDTGWPVFYADGILYQLTDGSTITGGQDINDHDEVVLYFNFGLPYTDIGLMRRIRNGDSEFDDDVDLVDIGALQRCFTGPGRVDGLCECRFLDIDHDGDVDLDDFALLQANLTGPGG